MATDKMLLLNLKAYPYGQLPSNSHHRFTVPKVMINRPSYCTAYKRQLLTCSSSSNVSRFVIANTMAASSEILLSTAEQPIYNEGGSCVLTPFHAEQTTLDAAGSSLLFVFENILNHAAHMADTALLGTQDYMEKLDEKVSKANMIMSSGLFCTIKQFLAMDKVIVLSELLVLAQKINVTLNLQEMQKLLCNKEIIETPKEIVKAFTGLIVAEGNLQPRTGGSTNKMHKQRSIIMANDHPQDGDQVEHPNAFAFSGTPDQNPPFRPQLRMGKNVAINIPKNQESKYTFYFGSRNQAWLKEFENKATVIAKYPFMKEYQKNISINLFKIADDITEHKVQGLSKKEGFMPNFCPKFLYDHQNYSNTGHVSLVYDNSEVVFQVKGPKILKALGDFEEHWKKNLRYCSFEVSLGDHYNVIPN